MPRRKMVIHPPSHYLLLHQYLPQYAIIALAREERGGGAGAAYGEAGDMKMKTKFGATSFFHRAQSKVHT